MHLLGLVTSLDPWQSLGELIAGLWVMYGITLVALTLTGTNIGVLLVTALLARQRPRTPWTFVPLLALELYYGLFNPVAYLTILARSSGEAELVPNVSRSPLDAVAWLALLAFWTLRLLPLAERPRRRLARVGVVLAGLVVGAYLVRDVGQFAMARPSFGIDGRHPILQYVFPASLCALYVIPLLLLWHHWRTAATIEHWRRTNTFALVERRPARAVVALGGAFLLVSTILLFRHPSAQRTEAIVREHHNTILESAAAHHLDPQLLAALLYVLHREQISPFGAALEATLIETWLQDAKTGMALSDSLDLSVGIAQIKPTTAQSALLLAVEIESNAYTWKEYRGVTRLDPARFGLADQRLTIPHLDAWLPSRRQVVDQLLDDRAAIQMAAAVLDLHARAWETANPAWSIRHRPEILATLYTLGFERSRPKATPGSSAFGLAVAEAMGRFPDLAADPLRERIPSTAQ